LWLIIVPKLLDSAVVDCGVVVVGAGPAGLACALTLARRGYQDIHVLERNPSATFFEQDKVSKHDIQDERWTS